MASIGARDRRLASLQRKTFRDPTHESSLLPRQAWPDPVATACSSCARSASVWSKNPERAFAVASQINSGTVWVNRHLNLQPDIPFRGDKQSGIGTELGHAGLEEYTQPRIINMAKQQA
jgi:hypothetical protein